MRYLSKPGLTYLTPVSGAAEKRAQNRDLKQKAKARRWMHGIPTVPTDKDAGCAKLGTAKHARAQIPRRSSERHDLEEREQQRRKRGRIPDNLSEPELQGQERCMAAYR